MTERLKLNKVKIKKYDYKKYIWQIQFIPRHILSKSTDSITIDFVNRHVIVRKTDSDTIITKIQTYEINEKDFETIIPFIEINAIKSYGEKEADERGTVVGYRDGWRLEYSYFTQEVPPRGDGILGWIDKDNPIEKIVEWLKKTYSGIEQI